MGSGEVGRMQQNRTLSTDRGRRDGSNCKCDVRSNCFLFDLSEVEVCVLSMDETNFWR